MLGNLKGGDVLLDTEAYVKKRGRQQEPERNRLMLGATAAPAVTLDTRRISKKE